jgi:hypothetical protein
MKLVRGFLFLLLTLGLVGCNVSGDVMDLTQRTPTTSFGSLTGITPGATNQTTSGGYKVSSTVGEVFSDVKQTTAKGYTIYSNIEGNAISETQVTVLH